MSALENRNKNYSVISSKIIYVNDVNHSTQQWHRHVIYRSPLIPKSSILVDTQKQMKTVYIHIKFLTNKTVLCCTWPKFNCLLT